MLRNAKKIKVFLTRHFPETGIELLSKEGFNVTAREVDEPMSQAELINESKQNNAMLCTMTEKIDKLFLNKCKHLEVISQFGVGYDNIDITEATRLGIPVGFTPDVLSEATADVAFGLMIAASRKMFYLHNTISKGEWSCFIPKAHLGTELRDKTLGIFGLGRIGLEMARLCRGAYNMDIIYHNRTPNTAAENLSGAKFVGFNDLLQQSDVLSVHCSLTEETNGIFDKAAFRKMKSTAIFINTARGLVHNEIDLINALENKEIWGAGLDVTNPEPMKPGNPLLSMENVAVLPHVGSATIETRNKMSVLAAENIIEFYRGNRIPNIVNPEVYTGC